VLPAPHLSLDAIIPKKRIQFIKMPFDPDNKQVTVRARTRSHVSVLCMPRVEYRNSLPRDTFSRSAKTPAPQSHLAHPYGSSWWRRKSTAGPCLGIRKGSRVMSVLRSSCPSVPSRTGGPTSTPPSSQVSTACLALDHSQPSGHTSFHSVRKRGERGCNLQEAECGHCCLNLGLGGSYLRPRQCAAAQRVQRAGCRLSGDGGEGRRKVQVTADTAAVALAHTGRRTGITRAAG
jgi:hypothetical protein